MPQTFTATKIDARIRNKTALQAKLGLAPGADRPLFAVVSRLSEQKGLDLLLRALPALTAKGAQLALLGSGERTLEIGFAEAAAAGAGSVGCVFGYDERLAHLFQAGADFVVVPSRFEPCGLTQLCALRYGAPPIVSRVGGLADTVIDANEAALTAGVATGVQFSPLSVEALVYALDRALAIFRDPPTMRRLRLNGMRADVSWRGPAQRYAALYRSIAAPCRMSDSAACLGVAVSPHGLEAALALTDAEGASLCIYDGDREVFRATMARDAGGVFRGLAPGFGAAPATDFGSRARLIRRGVCASTPPNCLPTLMPGASTAPFRLHPSMFAFGEDSGPYAPKAVAGAPSPSGEPGHKRIAVESLVIYELNLRGFSRLNPAIPESARGTFAGLAHPASIAHLAALGVTAVEIMPADPFVDERHLPPLGLANAWGYNPVVFGSPDPRLAPGGWAEVRAATDALHCRGHRGDPRCRLQSQRRERPVRPHPFVPRSR